MITTITLLITLITLLFIAVNEIFCNNNPKNITMNNKLRKTLVLIVCTITVIPLFLIILESVIDGYTNSTLHHLLSDD